MLTQYNRGPTYLSAGEAPLPMVRSGRCVFSCRVFMKVKMYMAMAFLYIGALTAWILIYMREAEGYPCYALFSVAIVIWLQCKRSLTVFCSRKVLLIHYLMTVLIILKIFSLAFRAIELHYKNITGHPGRWDIVYYIFQLYVTLPLREKCSVSVAVKGQCYLSLLVWLELAGLLSSRFWPAGRKKSFSLLYPCRFWIM